MKKPEPDTFVDKYGRTWPGEPTLGGLEVTGVYTRWKTLTLRVGPISFIHVNPDAYPPAPKPKRPRKPKEDK